MIGTIPCPGAKNITGCIFQAIPERLLEIPAEFFGDVIDLDEDVLIKV
jgi:hypothetical protein